jgi:hypothetical protein
MRLQYAAEKADALPAEPALRIEQELRSKDAEIRRTPSDASARVHQCFTVVDDGRLDATRVCVP